MKAGWNTNGKPSRLNFELLGHSKKKMSVTTYLKRSTYTFCYVTKDFFLCLFVSCER